MYGVLFGEVISSSAMRSSMDLIDETMRSLGVVCSKSVKAYPFNPKQYDSIVEIAGRAKDVLALTSALPYRRVGDPITVHSKGIVVRVDVSSSPGPEEAPDDQDAMDGDATP